MKERETNRDGGKKQHREAERDIETEKRKLDIRLKFRALKYVF